MYQHAIQELELPGNQVLHVAAHAWDIRGARAAGMKTAFVYRPLEFGPDRVPEKPGNDAFDLSANDFLDLASKLGT